MGDAAGRPCCPEGGLLAGTIWLRLLPATLEPDTSQTLSSFLTFSIRHLPSTAHPAFFAAVLAERSSLPPHHPERGLKEAGINRPRRRRRLGIESQGKHGRLSSGDTAGRSVGAGAVHGRSGANGLPVLELERAGTRTQGPVGTLFAQPRRPVLADDAAISDRAGVGAAGLGCLDQVPLPYTEAVTRPDETHRHLRPVGLVVRPWLGRGVPGGGGVEAVGEPSGAGALGFSLVRGRGWNGYHRMEGFLRGMLLHSPQYGR